MKSKFRLTVGKWVAFFAFVFTSIVLQANAQSSGPVQVYAIQPNYYGPVYGTYMMGVVNLQGGNVQANVSTNIGNIGQNPNQQASTNSCPAFLTQFHALGSTGPEVVKLQQFLNQYNGAHLNGLGYFGSATAQEVKNLQYAYGILPTGNQLAKTTMLINAINCGQVKKVARTVYSAQNVGGYVSYLGSENVKQPNMTKGGVPLENIYPNPDLIEYPTNNNTSIPNRNTTVNPPMTGSTPNASSSFDISSSSTSSFFSSFDKDYQKIRDNYKAYLLVFVLVLALFWFLRKAATE